MSTQYTVILKDDYGWGGQEGKDKVINIITSKLKEEQDVTVYLVGTESSLIILEWESFPIELPQYKHYILDYCDRAFYYTDEGVCLSELERKEPSEFERRLNRLTEDIKHTKSTYYPDFLDHIHIRDLIDIYNKKIKKEDL
jgi:hypothetical protein